MDDEILFTKTNWHGHDFDCVVVNRINVYIIMNWNGTNYECFEIDTRNGNIIKDNLKLTPIYKAIGNDCYKIKSVAIY